MSRASVSELRGTAWVDGTLHRESRLELADGRIAAIHLGPALEPEAPPPPDAPLLLPGLIDLHVHGGDGADFMDGSLDAHRAITAFHARHGTTGLAATTLSGSRQAITSAVVTTAAAARQPTVGAAILALHLEGPYLATARAGAQDRDSLRAPDEAELADWVERAAGLPLRMTLAPELPGASALIERFRERVAFAIGHSDADSETVSRAVEAGATHFTHLWNAMAPLHHRRPGPIGVALTDPRVTAEVIADGLHLDPIVLRLSADALGERLVLVSDAMRAAGLADGSFSLYRHQVTVAGGEARLADGTLAGSTLTMIEALRRMVALGLPLGGALRAASELPARLLGLSDRKGRIARGLDADLLVTTPALEVERTLVAGHEVYRR